MLFSYIAGHVPVNFRNKMLKMRNLLKKIFTHPLQSKAHVKTNESRLPVPGRRGFVPLLRLQIMTFFLLTNHNALVLDMYQTEQSFLTRFLWPKRNWQSAFKLNNRHQPWAMKTNLLIILMYKSRSRSWSLVPGFPRSFNRLISPSSSFFSLHSDIFDFFVEIWYIFPPQKSIFFRILSQNISSNRVFAVNIKLYEQNWQSC